MKLKQIKVNNYAVWTKEATFFATHTVLNIKFTSVRASCS